MILSHMWDNKKYGYGHLIPNPMWNCYDYC